MRVFAGWLLQNGARTTVFGGLQVPSEILVEEYALDLLGRYFRRDERGYAYSGAMFDTYPADPAAAEPGPADAADVVTDSDLIALSMLGIRVTGHEALAITRYHSQDIRELLGRIPADACIRSSTTVALLARGGPAWALWDLLRGSGTGRRTPAWVQWPQASSWPVSAPP